MKERPILFSAQMVRALLNCTKSQTRRAVKPQPEVSPEGNLCGAWLSRPLGGLLLPKVSDIVMHCPYGKPGDRLWVKETTIKVEDHGYIGPCYVESDEGRAVLDHGLSPAPDDVTEVEPEDIRKRPAIHMPRTMSRILLDVTAVRVERLQDISEADSRAEGARECDLVSGREVLLAGSSQRSSFVLHYRDIWEQINGADSWAANPWVWVVEFRRVA